MVFVDLMMSTLQHSLILNYQVTSLNTELARDVKQIDTINVSHFKGIDDHEMHKNNYIVMSLGYLLPFLLYNLFHIILYNFL